MLTPQSAAWRYAMGRLLSNEIVQLAHEWLSAGTYSDALVHITMELHPRLADVGPLFEAALAELGTPVPDRNEAARRWTTHTVRQMALGEGDPVESARFLYYVAYVDWFADLPEGRYAGSKLGFEHIFCWLREIEDLRDGSPRLHYADLPAHEAEAALTDRLRSSAQDWLDASVLIPPLPGGER